MAKLYEYWPNPTEPIPSAKLNQMTLDWIRNGHHWLSSYGVLAHSILAAAPATDIYLGWVPHSDTNHVWSRVLVEAVVHTNLSAGNGILQIRADGSAGWTGAVTFAGSPGPTMSTQFGSSSSTRMVIPISYPVSGDRDHHIGMRIHNASVGWAAGKYVAWNIEAYLMLAGYEPYAGVP